MSINTITPDRTTAAISRSSGINVTLHIAFVATCVAFLALYAQTLASLVYTWAHAGTFEYAFLIFPVCAVLVWMRRGELKQTRAEPTPQGMLAVFLLSALWLAGALTDVNVVRHFSVVAMMPCLVYAFYGPAITKTLAFPLAYLFFAVPFGNFMVGPLQDITARLSVFALKGIDMPVLLTGRIILTPASAWHVAEACSGVKFFIATTAFGVLYAYLFYRSLTRRLIFVICAMVVPVIANGLRVFFTILIGEYFGLHYATGTDHLIFGWQFFGTVLLLLFLAGWPWHEFDPEPTQASGSRNDTNIGVGGTRASALAVFGIVVLALAPGWYVLAQKITSPSAAGAAHDWPASLGEFTRLDLPPQPIDTNPQFVSADVRTVAYYGAPDDTVRIDYARYDGAAADADQELITARNHLFDASSWQSVSRAAAQTSGANSMFTERVLKKRQGKARSLLWYVYKVNGHYTTSSVVVKAWQAWYALRAQTVRSSVIVLSANANDLGRARNSLREIAPAALRTISRPSG